MPVALQLITKIPRPLAKSFIIPLSLTAAASGTDPAIHKKIVGSDKAALIISNKEIEDIMEIVKFFEKSGLLIKSVCETIKIDAKEQ